MKLSHILGIVIIAAAIGIIVSTAGDASQYVNFDTAFKMAAEGNNEKIHVVGELKKNSDNQVVGVHYDPKTNPNFLAFTVVDDNKEEHEVVCYNPPASMQDFTRSEKVVLIGRVIEGKFVASEILMKCPSKYEEKELKAGL
jgi:cytochrome c-type biogenesis protein CcmE